jgi:transcriptional regulator with XRE-family HTH domain
MPGTFCFFLALLVVVTVKKKVAMSTNKIHEQPNEPLTNYLRTHRLKTGFTQHELAAFLGYMSHMAISRHERQQSVPCLVIALSYEIVYGVPVSEIFSGLAKSVEREVEAQLAEYETYLGTQSAAGPRAASVARKLEWLSERRSSGYR